VPVAQPQASNIQSIRLPKKCLLDTPLFVATARRFMHDAKADSVKCQ
jgi:hypothetical protein